MRMRYRRFGATSLLAAAIGLVGTASAHAHEHPPAPQQIDTLDVPVDPLSEDMLITDGMEGQLTMPTGVTCSYESVQTAANPVPADGSFQLMYVVPADVTPTKHLDVPRSCSDGSVRYSSLARSSRNMASWLAARDAGLNFRTLTLAYTHNFTGAKYSTRVIRRMVSAYTRDNWNNTAMRSADGTSSPRLNKLAAELYADGFMQSATKYHTLLDAGVFPTCSATECSYTAGVADRGGVYGMLNRYYFEPGTYAEKYHRFGCATRGDAMLFHEGTHMVGAAHVDDHARDLMTADGGGSATFKASSPLVWDYFRNNYHNTVRSSAYVGLTEQPGNYYVCT